MQLRRITLLIGDRHLADRSFRTVEHNRMIMPFNVWCSELFRSKTRLSVHNSFHLSKRHGGGAITPDVLNLRFKLTSHGKVTATIPFTGNV